MPKYYNRIRLRFDKLYAETGKAWLVIVNGREIWIPKKVSRKFSTNNKLQGSVVIPEWLYKELIVETPDDDMYETIVVKHSPLKIEAIENNIIKDLRK